MLVCVCLHVCVCVYTCVCVCTDAYSDSDGKESPCSAGDLGSIPGLRRSPGEGNGNPLQYSCLENPMDRGVCRPQSMGSQRVRHNRATNTHTCVYAHACVCTHTFMILFNTANLSSTEDAPIYVFTENV